ncbi:hypothetical protein [Aestuariimicrobium kwangyangense]|uniref:hypothetical protein n=1 Tax=Aestuariimicrobium kwangyangense TaxID=396389 RepID=UPI0003B3331F|nr:hypothetical protein [Aestuariimicrobium kwangyangense]
MAAASDCQELVGRLHAKFVLHQDLTTDELTDLFSAAIANKVIARLAEEYLAK